MGEPPTKEKTMILPNEVNALAGCIQAIAHEHGHFHMAALITNQRLASDGENMRDVLLRGIHQMSEDFLSNKQHIPEHNINAACSLLLAYHLASVSKLVREPMAGNSPSEN